MVRRIVVAGAFLLAVSAAYGADFTDDFENYTTGTICGQAGPPGGWEEWTTSIGMDVCGEVSTEQANSGTKCLKIIGDPGGSQNLGDDTVQQFTVDGGVWTFSIMTYVPSSATGQAYVILLNQYLPTQNWSLQVCFDNDLGELLVDFTGEIAVMIKDRWVEFRAEIDLDNDLVDYYYDDVQFVFGKSWTGGVSGNGLPQIRALDLYGQEPGLGTSGTYFDDVSLTVVGGGLCGDANCDAAFNGADIDPFFLALGNPAAWEAQYGSGGLGCDIVKSCDINYDGLVNGADIDPFFVALGLGYCP